MKSLKNALKLSGILIDEIVVGLFLLVILPSAGIEIPLKVSLTIITLLILKDVLFVPLLWKVLDKKVEVGGEALVGREATAVENLNPEGVVKVGGEYWRAESIEGDIKAGETVKIVGLSGLKLLVERQK